MKKKAAGAMWENIQPVLDLYRPYFVVHRTETASLHLTDADPESDFYFIVRLPNADGNYPIESKPFSWENTQERQETIVPNSVSIVLNAWLDVLKQFDQLVTIYDDPILRSYEAEFAAQFQVADEDADHKPFDMHRQLLLVQYIDWMIKRIEARKEAASYEKAAQLDQIVADCQTLREDLPGLTQNQTISRLTKAWAKVRKYGIDFMKEIFTEYKKEAIKGRTKELMSGRLPDIDAVIGLTG